MGKYLITGATGYIGSMLVKKILKINKNADITIIARNVKKAKEMFSSEVKILDGDLSDSAIVNYISGEYEYIIHCAAVTKSSEMISKPTEVIKSIVNTTQNVCEIAVKCYAESMVFLSSMEVYGNIDCSDGHRVSENELGDIDIFNARSCYPQAKRMAENVCYCYYKQYGLPVKIARLSQTFGKGILKDENRVFAQFAKAAVKGEDIVLHTAGTSVGNYCDIDDTVNAVLLLLENGENGEAYNVTNEDNTMTIRQMAQLVAKEFTKDKIKVVFDIPDNNIFGYAADTGMRLSAEKLKKLGWSAKKSLTDMYKDVISEQKCRL